MIYFDCSEEKKYVGIPKRYSKEEERKSCFVDRNRPSDLPFKSRTPLFKIGAKESSYQSK